MGLFDVNMPILYGGGPKSFLRLQEAILKYCKDQSILAYRVPEAVANIRSLTLLNGYQSFVLAPSPNYFLDDIRYDWASKHDS